MSQISTSSVSLNTLVRSTVRYVRRYRIVLGFLTLLLVLHQAYQIHLLSQQVPTERYIPGRLGESLVEQHGQDTAPDRPAWSFFQQKPRGHTLFPLLPYEEDDSEEISPCSEEDLPEGFQPGPDQKQTCWRLRLIRQLKAWKPHNSFRTWGDQTEKNEKALSKLATCLLSPLHSEPLIPGGCSLKTTKIVLGFWWFWGLGFTKAGTSGEAIWLSSMIDAMEEQGYTVLSVTEYEGMVTAHSSVPDLVSHILTEEKHLLSCISDPRCISPIDFKPTKSLFPALDIDEMGNAIKTKGMEGNPEGPRQKWVWTESQLTELSQNSTQLGTIPLYKLFCLTWWGTKTGEGYWPTPKDFSWNPLGSKWTISPFAYPNHTYMSYSIERECSALPSTGFKEKKDRVFVLAKLAEYFLDGNTAPPVSLWDDFSDITGLQPISVATDREDGSQGWLGYKVPEGVTVVPKMSREEFELEVALSKVMLGIGRPFISPSVYTSLCQGTPVVLPKFAEWEQVKAGYNLFDGNYAQHGPASLIGPPFVYTYDKPNATELLDLVKVASNTPIDRYIPPEMTWTAVMKDVDDLMRFNWRLHAGKVTGIVNENRMDVIGRCFEIGRCKPLVLEL